MADVLLVLPVLLFSVVAHEFAHAWTAHREGDDTALHLGRLTLNPIPHLDPIMSVILPALLVLTHSGFVFGAARPVPVNRANFRHPVRGDLIVSSAGIAMNALIAIAAGAVFVVLKLFGAVPGVSDVAALVQRIAMAAVSINLLLACFNLVPLPPLDGSHLLYHALPRAWRPAYERVGRFGFLVLIMSFWVVPGMWDVLLWPAETLTTVARHWLRPFALGSL